jgi:hypothetical protein
MMITESFQNPPQLPADFNACWTGPDRGLLAAWLRGLEKRNESPELATLCERGEFPILAWKGGVEKPVKGIKTGSLLYLATWQALRGEDLNIDTESEPVLQCSKTGTRVAFTLDTKKLLNELPDGDS